MLFGAYEDFDGSDRGTIRITETNPGANPNWEGTFTNGQNETGTMHGQYQGGGIATPLARLGDEQPSLTSLSGASFGNSNGLAPDSFVTSFGQNLADDIFVDGDLPTQLGGLSVGVMDSGGQNYAARLYVVAPMQINFLMPSGVAVGEAIITVTRDGEAIAMETVQIATVSPGIFTAASSGMGVAAAVFLRVSPDGSRTDGLTFDNMLAPVPLDFGPAGSDLYVFLFTTGMRNSTGTVTATVDGIPVPFNGPVAQGQFDGLDQLNLGPLPRSLVGRGEVDVAITVDGKQANVVTIAFR